MDVAAVNEPCQQSVLLEMLQTIVNTRLQHYAVNLQLLLLLKSLKMKNSQCEATCESPRKNNNNGNHPFLPIVGEFRVSGSTKGSQVTRNFFYTCLCVTRS